MFSTLDDFQMTAENCVFYLHKYGYIQNAHTQDEKYFGGIRCREISSVYFLQGVKLSYKSYKILYMYFWNCPIKSYIFSKYPINHIFNKNNNFCKKNSTETALFVRIVNKNNMKLYYYLQRSSKI